MEADANPSFYNIVSLHENELWEDSILVTSIYQDPERLVASSITDLTITLGAKILFSTYAQMRIAALRYKISGAPSNHIHFQIEDLLMPL